MSSTERAEVERNEATPEGVARWGRFFRPEHHPFWLIVANGVIFQLSFAMFDPKGIVAAFLMELTGKEWLVGVALAIGPTTSTLPQLYASHLIADGRRRMPYYIKGAHIRWTSFAAILVMVPLLRHHPLPLALLFLVATGVIGFATGIGVVSFGDILTRTVAPRRRGRLFGLRIAIGSLFAFAAGGTIERVLDPSFPIRFPYNYLLLFACSGLLLIAAQLCFMRIKEPPAQPSSSHAATFGAFLRSTLRVVLRDKNARRYVIYRNLAPATWIPVSFVVPYAMEELGFRATVVGSFLICGVISAALSNLLWARLSDRVGNRANVRLGILFTATAVGLLALAPLVAREAAPAVMHGWLLLVVGLSEMGLTGIRVGELNYIYELGRGPDVPLYIGSLNTLASPALLLTPLVMGALAERFGYTVINLLGVGFGFAAILLTLTLREPRHDVAV